MFLIFANFYMKIAEQVGCVYFKVVTDILHPQNYFCGGSGVSDDYFLFLE